MTLTIIFYVVCLDTPAMVGWTIGGRVHLCSSALKGHPFEKYPNLRRVNLGVPMVDPS